MNEMVERASRRAFLGSLAFGAAALHTAKLFAVPGEFAQRLVETPPQTEGPFYPYERLPLDTDNDLLVINDSITPAVGEITHLEGRILDAKGAPVRGAVVEVWQCDGQGVYLAGATAQARRDANFQGFGRFATSRSGAYYFRTIKPVAYPGRTPHIHFKVKQGDRELLSTQCYIKGEPRNDRDGVFRRLRGQQARDAVLVDFRAARDSPIGELSATFDIVLGATPRM